MSNEQSTTTSTPSQGRLDKGEGSYYTPKAIAEKICDIAGYRSDDDSILTAHVIDPAAGDGAILSVTCTRYIKAALKNNWSSSDIAAAISKLFHAYELDEQELLKCRENVAATAQQLEVPLSADELTLFKPGDALALSKPDIGTMGFVLGNPPYVRIHNLEEKPDSPYVDGMCDLFYPFFDIGQQLLSPDGKMCYIAPSSWFTARAGRNMRQDLMGKSAIRSVCDFGHYQVFAPYATAYTAIISLDRNANGEVDVYPVSEDGSVGTPVAKPQGNCWVDGLFMPGSPAWMHEALSATGNIRVLNGYATNLDRVFISKERRFSGSKLERPVVKASRCETRYMIYPYRENGTLVPWKELEASEPDVTEMLSNEKEALLNRTQVPDDRWWQFGRSQGIADTFKGKVAVQSLVKPGETVRVMSAPAGCGVYGGVYVLGMEEDAVRKAVNSNEFFQYAAALRKYKSGGYYALGGKDLEHFLNWFERQNKA